MTSHIYGRNRNTIAIL